MTRRVRSRDLASGSVPSRALADGSVGRTQVGGDLLGSQLRPGSVDGSRVKEQSIRIKHLHPEMLPYPARVPFLVAASDASDEMKRVASYVCNGIADQETINAAIAATGESAWGLGRVLLSEGTFNISDALDFVAVIQGVGAGYNSTELIVGADITGPVIECNEVSGLRLRTTTSTIGTAIEAYDGSVDRVTVTASGSGSVGVGVSGYGYLAVTASRFDDCDVGLDVISSGKVTSTGSHYFNVAASGTGIAIGGSTNVASVAGCIFAATSSSGSVGIDNSSGGALNTDAAGSNVFSGFGTNIA